MHTSFLGGCITIFGGLGLFAVLWILASIIMVFPYVTIAKAFGIPDGISNIAFPFVAFIFAMIASVFLEKIYTKRKIRRWNAAHPNDPIREFPPDSPG